MDGTVIIPGFSLSLLCLVHMCPQPNKKKKKKNQDICFIYYEGSLMDSISLSSMLNPFFCLLFSCREPFHNRPNSENPT